MARLRIKTGDTVIVLTGKDRGKKGKVTQVLPSQRQLVVEGVNQMTKNIRGRKQGEKGQRVQFNSPIHISNVMFVDPKSGKPSRLGTQVVEKRRIRRVVRTGETVQ